MVLAEWRNIEEITSICQLCQCLASYDPSIITVWHSISISNARTLLQAAENLLHLLLYAETLDTSEGSYYTANL